VQCAPSRLGPIRSPIRWLSLTVLIGTACGPVEFPSTLALIGDNTITLEVPAFPPGRNVFQTVVVGGTEARVLLDLTNPFELLQPAGIAASVITDRVLIAGTDIDLFGVHTGTICAYNDPELESGGMAFLRPIREEGEFHLTLNTLMAATDPFIQQVFPEPLVFQATIDDTTRVTLLDLINLALGREANIVVSQTIESYLPDDLPILGGTLVTVDVTLKTAQEFPVDPLLDECEAFLAGE
jgi:hypothetical protein